MEVRGGTERLPLRGRASVLTPHVILRFPIDSLGCRLSHGCVVAVEVSSQPSAQTVNLDAQCFKSPRYHVPSWPLSHSSRWPSSLFKGYICHLLLRRVVGERFNLLDYRRKGSRVVKRHCAGRHSFTCSGPHHLTPVRSFLPLCPSLQTIQPEEDCCVNAAMNGRWRPGLEQIMLNCLSV